MKKIDKQKLYEIVRYLIVGVLTTLIGLLSYYGLVYTVLNPENAIELQIANIISWIVSVIFAYITNRIFVFKSKNKNKLKEITSFVGSRVVTLLMDMGIMFVGVTTLHFNDKFIKIISQVLVIIFNYIFSKLFVFNSKTKVKKSRKIKDKFELLVLVTLPLLRFVRLYFSNQIFNLVLFGIEVFLLSYFIISLFVLKKARVFLSILLGYILLDVTYLFCKELDVLSGLYFLVSIFYLPVVILYFNTHKNPYVNESFLTKYFYFYLFFFLLCFGLKIGVSSIDDVLFYSFLKEAVGIMVCLFPIIFKKLINHFNIITQIIGFLIVLSVIYFMDLKILAIMFLVLLFLFLWEERKNLKEKTCIFLILFVLGIGMNALLFFGIINQNFTLSVVSDKTHAITHTQEIFQKSNIDEQLFGIYGIEELHLSKINLDITDIFYTIGYVGFVFYLIILGYSLSKVRMNSYRMISFIFLVFASILMGGILTSTCVALIFGLLFCDIENTKKRILIVSNMYPSKRQKHYGSFVKNTKESLEELGFLVDKVVIKKHKNKIVKLISYVMFYFISFYKSIFYSYDYIYVHFVSHSTYPVLLGRMTSKKTKLVCNVHGNDIVPDEKVDEKNVIRSKKCLPYADMIISPSFYFKDVLKNDYNIDEEKIVVYPSGGVNLEVFQEKDRLECKNALGLDVHTSYLGYISRIEKDKGWDTLVMALNILKKENELKNKKVIIIGSGSEEAEFDKLIKKYKLEEYILRKDFVYQKELLLYYNAIDVFVYPTKRKSESLGLVGLEAMACKTFVIACDLYGPREYVKNLDNALTFSEDKDGKKLASQIKAFYKMNEKEKAKIIKNAYETAKKYDVNRSLEKLREIFK